MPMSPSVRLEWQAGKYVRLEEMGRWWAAVPPEARPAAHQSSIQEDFEGEWGDRRQELVFIGQDMQEADIRAALDETLVTEKEFAQGPQLWKSWLKLAHCEHDHEHCANMNTNTNTKSSNFATSNSKGCC